MNKDNPFRKLRRLFIRILTLSATTLPEEREGIWSIPKPLQVVYFVIFIGACIPMIVYFVGKAKAAHPGAGFVALASETSAEFATAGVGAAIGSLMAVQGLVFCIALYQFAISPITKRESISEERNRANVENNQTLQESDQPSTDAESHNISFDEPPPGEHNNSNNEE